jgi:Fe-S cluster biogenesis protein NfuA
MLAQHGGDVELLDIDAVAGAVHLNLLGSCHGCPSSTVTLRMAVETAIAEAAPEIQIIDVEQPTEDSPPVGEPVPITLGAKKTVFEECPAELVQR